MSHFTDIQEISDMVQVCVLGYANRLTYVSDKI